MCGHVLMCPFLDGVRSTPPISQSPTVQNKAVQFEDGTRPRSPEDRQHRRRHRTSSVSTDRPPTSNPFQEQPTRKKRSQSVSRAGSDSEDTVILPDRFDKDGRLKENSSSRITDRIENALNGRTAGSLLKKLFQDSSNDRRGR